MVSLVLFEVAGQTLALPAGAFCKVVASAPVTRLPFVGGDVEGLVAAGGVIVAQIDLARRAGLTPRPDEPSVLMLVRVGGGMVALRICRLLTKVDIDQLVIQAPESDAGPLVAGVFSWQDQPVRLLHLERVGLEGLVPVAVGRPVAVLGDPDLQTRPGSGPVPADAVLPFLLVRCNGDPHAVALDHVQEVVTVERLTALAHAPAALLGLTVLRGVPVPVLSLSRLLGQEPGPVGRTIPMVVIRHGERTLALAVEAILGLNRLEASAIHRLAAPRGGIGGYFVAASQALIAVLDPGTLLAAASDDGLAAFLPVGAGVGVAAPLRPEPERRFLTFLIGAEMYGMDLDWVERIAAHRAPLPLPGKRHAVLAGMVDIGGRVVPVADLRRPLGRPETVTRRTAFVVARGSKGVWALVVDRLARIVRIPVSAIKAGGAAPHFIGEIARIDRTLMPIVDPMTLDRLMA